MGRFVFYFDAYCSLKTYLFDEWINQVVFLSQIILTHGNSLNILVRTKRRMNEQYMRPVNKVMRLVALRWIWQHWKLGATGTCHMLQNTWVEEREE